MVVLTEEIPKYEKLGFRVIPFHIFRNEEGKIIKAPPKELKNTNYLEAEEFNTKIYERLIQNGIAAVTGKISGILVVDIDTNDDGLKAWEQMIKLNEDPKTWKAKSRSGGYHYYFKYESKLSTYKSSKRCFEFDDEIVGIDIRNNDGLIILPPSSFEEGKYEWINSPWDIELGNIPDWLLSYHIDSESDYGNEKKSLIWGDEKSHANLFTKRHKNKVMLEGKENYKYSNETTLWELQTDNQLINYISNFLSKEVFKELKKLNIKLEKEEDKNKKDFIYSDMNKLLTIGRHIEKYQHCKNVWNFVLGSNLLKPLVIQNKINSTPNFISFKNGIYDFKKNEFRKRIKEDYQSECLDYDYKKVSEEEINKVRQILLDISNSDNETLEFCLSWLGYCLTGETTDKKFLGLIGTGAENGKSTMAELYDLCLPIYCVKLDKKTFELGYAKQHKQIARLINKNIRLAYIEEMSKKKIDISLLKDIVTAFKINNEKMFGTSVDIFVFAKLYLTSNSIFVFDTDSGMERRGISVELNNKFISKEDYDELNDKKGFFIKKSTLRDEFRKNDDKKLAFIQLLIPYACQYYKKLQESNDESGLVIPKKISDQFKGVCNQNDKLQMFLDDHYEITKDDNDIISKHTFIEHYEANFKCKIQWINLLSDIKRKKIKYNDQKRVIGLGKGALIGIREILYLENIAK